MGDLKARIKESEDLVADSSFSFSQLDERMEELNNSGLRKRLNTIYSNHPSHPSILGILIWKVDWARILKIISSLIYSARSTIINIRTSNFLIV